MDKFQPLRDAGTNGANFDLDTDAIVAHLRAWDESYGIALSDVGPDRVYVTFERLPNDVSALAADIYDFCPDTIDQHFGYIAEMMEMADEMGKDLPAELVELTDGVDMEDDNYGLELLKRSLAKNKAIALWWD